MSVTIPATLLQSFASVVKAGASTDGDTPIIMVGEITFTGDSVRVVATDRYVAVVAEYALEPDKDNPRSLEPFTVRVTAAKLAAAAKTFNVRGSVAPVTFALEQLEDNADTLTITSPYFPGERVAERQLKGNFPSVERLFPDETVDRVDTPAGIGLNLSFVGRMSAIQLPGETPAAAKSSAWRMYSMPVTNPTKPGPVLLERGGIRVLVQPNLIVR